MNVILVDTQMRIKEIRYRVPAYVPAQLTFKTLPANYLPGRGLLYSVIVHEITVFTLLLMAAHTLFPSNRIRPHALMTASERERAIYLPVIGGGNEGGGSAGGRSGALGKAASVPAHGSPGFTYSGPQPVLSNPPNPLNLSLTLERPGMQKLPILREFVSLPNIVQNANSGAVPIDVRANKSSLPAPRAVPVAAPKVAVPSAGLKLVASQPELPTLQPAPVPAAPKLSLPVRTSQEAVTLSATVSQPTPVEAPKPIETVKTDHLSDVLNRGMDRQTLVALSPLPAPPSPDAKIPMAETRGRFAVSPLGSVAAPTPVPGSKFGGAPSQTAGIGEGPNSQNAVAENKLGGGNGRGSQAAAGTGGSGTGTGTAIGSGNGGNGENSGRGFGGGSGLGEGSGSTSASGTGGGSGHGGGTVPGITIQGGRLVGGMPARPQGRPVPPQVAYGMTIVSTPKSGGGLPDFGIFSNERVYTVFLDTRMTTQDQSPSWTLQYAPMPAGSESEAEIRAQGLKGVTPPYALAKEIPHWPAELVHQYVQRVIVVSGVIDTEGKLGQVLVMQSPDDRLTGQLTEALSRWVFRPAELNGHPISAKVMLGVPLSLAR